MRASPPAYRKSGIARLRMLAQTTACARRMVLLAGLWLIASMHASAGAAEPLRDEATGPVPAATMPAGAVETPSADGNVSDLPAYLQRAPRDQGAAYDPWERYNRHVYHFNKRLDTAVVKPLAEAYAIRIPARIRNGVTHFFANVRQPVTAANLLLQGHPGRACQAVGRFVVDATIGVGGVMDPATRMGVPEYREDLGQTFARWGWRRSRYFLLPFAGPGTLRDRAGSVVDAQLAGPVRFIGDLGAKIAFEGGRALDERARILPLDELAARIPDDYVLVREAWSQRRAHEIDAPDH